MKPTLSSSSPELHPPSLSCFSLICLHSEKANENVKWQSFNESVTVPGYFETISARKEI